MYLGRDLISGFLKDEAYNGLLKMINDGKIKYGETYSLNKIAAQLNMSRTPVRDAIQRLCDEARIDLLPSRGFRLHKINDSEILHMYHFSNAIEGYCVYCLANAQKNGQKKEYIDKLKELLDKMKESYASSASFEEFYELDNEFHRVIIGSIEDDFFYVLSDSKRGFYNHIELHLTPDPIDRETIIRFHQNILDAILDGDSSRAYISMIEHADYMYDNYISQSADV